MNTRERFIRVLTGKDVDRVPFIKVFGGNNTIVPEWAEKFPNIGTYIDELLGFEAPYRGWQVAPVRTGLHGTPPPVVISETPEEKRIRYGDGTVGVTVTKDGRSYSHAAEYPVKCWDDWENIKTKWLDPDDPSRFPSDWDRFVQLYANRDYPLQLTCGGVYGFARKMLGDELLCYNFYDEPELVKDIMDTYIGMCIKIWEKMVVNTDFDLIECWEDMAFKCGSLVSREHFDEFLKPQYRRICDFAGNAEIPLVLVDSDGNIQELVKWMADAGVNSMYPFEVEAGNDLAKARADVPNMGCLGGLDKECMARGKAEMDYELEKARALIPLGRFIPGPDHFVLENVGFENYEYFMRGLKKVVLETKF